MRDSCSNLIIAYSCSKYPKVGGKSFIRKVDIQTGMRFFHLKCNIITCTQASSTSEQIDEKKLIGCAQLSVLKESSK